jgi:ketosteroid isomerase-like protein
MKPILGYLTIFAAQILLGCAAVADDATIEQSALEFQASRFKAMVDADVGLLETYLADDLTYAHTTGWIETKSEFLLTVESGKINYMAVEPRDVLVRIYGDVAVMTGLSEMRGAVDDRTVSFTIRFLDVSRRVGDAWQLVAWQSVRMPDDED